MGFSNWIGRAYDAITTNGRRRVPRLDMRSEDRLFLPLDRDQLLSNARSLRRNAAIAAWAIRKHQDYVSTFNFQCRSGNPELDREVESLMNWWARPLNCDVSGRFSLHELIRMAEGLRTTDGDCFFYKLSDGRIQLIEADRVRTPTDLGEYKDTLSPNEFADFVHGVEVTPSGKPLRYAIAERTGGIGQNGFTLKEVTQAQYVYHLAYRERYDQIRGISPLSSAINQFADLYEAQEYALAKMKLSQLFALKFKHGTVAEDGSDPYKFEFGQGPQIVELDPTDDAEFLESATPSNEFQAFMLQGIQAALKSLDIPFSFYDESHTNYSGARQAWIMYEQSCESKRNQLRQLLNNLTVWRLSLFIADGHLNVPAGMSMDDIVFEWIPAGIPWIDPLKEVTANALAVKSGLKSRQMLCKENGDDFFTIVDQIAQENEYLAQKGLNTDIDNITLNLHMGDTPNEDGNAKPNKYR
jgi:lambda family phage portal protein